MGNRLTDGLGGRCHWLDMLGGGRGGGQSRRKYSGQEHWLIVLEGWSSARRRHTTCHLASCICCDQSAVTMRISAGLTSAKLTLFFRSSTAGWTTDSEYLLGAEFSLHGDKIMPQRFTRMVNFEQLWQLLHQRLAPTRTETDQGFAIAGWLGNRDLP